jgi:uncharacterized membrane protein
MAVAAVAPAKASAIAVGGYAAFVGGLAAAAADTWATELGTLSGTTPRSLRTGRPVSPGTSGAVSILGTGAAALGAATVAGAALLAGGAVTGAPVWDFGLFVGAGLAGMGADGLAGAFLQAQYRATTVECVEEPSSGIAQPTRGWSVVGNNAVNLVGTTVGAGIVLAGVLLVG